MAQTRRIDLFIIKKCCNRCIFCSERNKLDGSELSFAKIKNILVAERSRGANLVHFVGGEPTLHTHFPEILKLSKALQYNTFIISNAIMFSSYEFCIRTLPYLDEIMISIHGHNNKIHSINTRNPAAFMSVLQGMKNLQKYYKGRLQATTAITNLNYRFLAKIAELIHNFGITEYQCMSIVPTGEGSRTFYEIFPKFSVLSPHIINAIRFCELKNIKIRFSGIPMCILGDRYAYSYDLWEPFKIDNRKDHDGAIRLWNEPHTYVENNFKIDIGRIKTRKCRQCLKNSVCGGVYKKYFLKYSDDELIPFK
ncbi:MAG: radical SAM protein [Candidatus Omnitrophota bacterium]